VMVPVWVVVLTVSLGVAPSEGFYAAALGLGGQEDLGVAPRGSGLGCETATNDAVGAVMGCSSWKHHLASAAAAGFWRAKPHPRDQMER